jgi:hypothetical protein
LEVAASKGTNMIVKCFLIRRILCGGGLIAAMCVFPLTRIASQTPSAKEVLATFCSLDLEGGQLSAAGWERVSRLFVSPGAARRDEITVVKDLYVADPTLDQNKAHTFIEYIEIGLIQPSTARFSTLRPILVRAAFDLVRTSASNPGSAEWRIVGPVPKPRLTVDAAIRYATKLRADAKDVSIKKNADQLVIQLNRFR